MYTHPLQVCSKKHWHFFAVLSKLSEIFVFHVLLGQHFPWIAAVVDTLWIWGCNKPLLLDQFTGTALPFFLMLYSIVIVQSWKRMGKREMIWLTKLKIFIFTIWSLIAKIWHVLVWTSGKTWSTPNHDHFLFRVPYLHYISQPSLHGSVIW